MRMLAMAFLSISAAIVFIAAYVWLKKALGTASLRTRRQRIKGFSIFDLQLSVGGAEQSKREAALYLTLKSSPAEPHSAARLLFDEKVRRLGE
jgi:hypothetical protein